AVGDHGGVGDAVADHLVERGAARLGEVLVAEGGGIRAVVEHVLVGDAVDLVGGHPRGDGLAGRGQRTGRDAAGDAHLLDHLSGLHPRLAALLHSGLPDVFGALDRGGDGTDLGGLTGGERCTTGHDSTLVIA